MTTTTATRLAAVAAEASQNQRQVRIAAPEAAAAGVVLHFSAAAAAIPYFREGDCIFFQGGFLIGSRRIFLLRINSAVLYMSDCNAITLLSHFNPPPPPSKNPLSKIKKSPGSGGGRPHSPPPLDPPLVSCCEVCITGRSCTLYMTIQQRSQLCTSSFHGRSMSSFL